MTCCNNSGKNGLLLFPLLLLGIAVVLAMNFPELRRYLRMEQM